VSGSIEQVLEFLGQQQARQAESFRQLQQPHLLTFVGTARDRGQRPSVAVRRLSRLEFDDDRQRVEVHLAGPLPRPPQHRELVAASLVNVPQIRGYQVKTADLVVRRPEDLVALRNDGATLHGAQLFTVHHSPNTMQMFLYERIPLEDVRIDLEPVRFAVVAVGVRANLSPRFVFGWRRSGEGLELFHGDGVPRKTFANLRENPAERRVVVDLETFQGWALSGETAPFLRDEYPEEASAIDRGFQQAGWGEVRHYFRFRATSWAPIGPDLDGVR
jgi:hypothetical protein